MSLNLADVEILKNHPTTTPTKFTPRTQRVLGEKGYLKISVTEKMQVAGTLVGPDDGVVLVPLCDFDYDPDDNRIIVEPGQEEKLKNASRLLTQKDWDDAKLIEQASKSHNERLSENQNLNIQKMMAQNVELNKKMAEQQAILTKALATLSELVAKDKQTKK